uniref:Uncharacterized protein n=1 Tax=Arundo donax TaxID=35708 RepID=A0A0A8Y2U6_ARUDO
MPSSTAVLCRLVSRRVRRSTACTCTEQGRRDWWWACMLTT